MKALAPLLRLIRGTNVRLRTSAQQQISRSATDAMAAAISTEIPRVTRVTDETLRL
jgi:hypothetical protein